MPTATPVEPSAPTLANPDRTPDPPERGEVWDLLGGARFVLALIVVAVHAQDLTARSRFAYALQKMGAFPAVMAFFIISGYSIGHSITRRPEGYLLRRVRRIYPLYALAILASLGPSAVIGPVNGWLARTVAGNLVFLESFGATSVPGNPVVWTLAVEVAFYTLAPVLVRLPTATLIGLASASAVAFVIYPHTHWDYYARLTHGLPMLFLGWAWLAGFIYQRVRRSRFAGPILLTAVVILFDLNSTFVNAWSRATIVSVLALLITGPAWRLPTAVRRILAFGGDLSYPLYLFHAPPLLLYVHAGGQSQLLVLVLSVPIAGLMLAVDVLIRRATSGPFLTRWVGRRVLA